MPKSSEAGSLELSEKMIDEALIALVGRYAGIRSALLEAAGIQDTARVGTFSNARRSVADARGETDVWLEWSNPEGDRAILLVENKLTAGFQPRQGTRYRERADELLGSGVSLVRTVLIAPARYFLAASADVRAFDVRISLENLAGWIQDADPLAPELEVWRASLARVEAGGALGAKGLFVPIHERIAATLESRGSRVAIRNHATDWIFFDHPSAVRGVEMRYRIRQKIAEIAFTNYFRGDLELVLAKVDPGFEVSTSGSYTFVRLAGQVPSGRWTEGDENHAEAGEVVDALEELLLWWSAVMTSVRVESEW